jgi:hypothetical protein
MRIVPACLLVAGALLGGRQNAAMATEVVGVGLAPCSTWIADRAAPDSAEAVRDRAWVVGFLSGVAYAGSTTDPLRGMNAEAVAVWIDKYCADNRLDTIVTAATRFYAAHQH